MKHILLLLTLLLVWSTVALAEWNTPTYEPLVSDTAVAAEKDTNTFITQESADGIKFEFIALGAGTVSAQYRNFERPASIHRGGSAEAVIFMDSTGAKLTSLVCVAGDCYTMLIDPLNGDYHQIVITANATIPYLLICGQRDRQ